MRLDILASTTDEVRLIGALLQARSTNKPIDKKNPAPPDIDRFFHDNATPISEINRMVTLILPNNAPNPSINPNYIDAVELDDDDNEWGGDDDDEDNDPI